jgi:hypothetical protein
MVNVQEPGACLNCADLTTTVPTPDLFEVPVVNDCVPVTDPDHVTDSAVPPSTAVLVVLGVLTVTVLLHW